MSRSEPAVFVVDDDISVRDSLRNLLRSVGLKVETFSSAQEFLSSGSSGPGCLVLDVRMPGLSGLDLQLLLAERQRRLPIIFLSGHADIPMSVRAIKAGAVEFLTKPFRDQDLLDAVRLAIDRDLQNHRLDQEIAELRARYTSLTQREHEVLQCVLRGLVNKQIAAELCIAESTVKLHRGRLMHKMKAASLADLIRMAQQCL